MPRTQTNTGNPLPDRKSGGMERITVTEAARMLDLPEYTVRYYVSENMFHPPIGVYMKKKKHTRGNYIIYREKVETFLREAGEAL